MTDAERIAKLEQQVVKLTQDLALIKNQLGVVPYAALNVPITTPPKPDFRLP